MYSRYAYSVPMCHSATPEEFHFKDFIEQDLTQKEFVEQFNEGEEWRIDKLKIMLEMNGFENLLGENE